MAFIVIVQHDEKQLGRLVAEVKRAADALVDGAASLKSIADGSISAEQLASLQTAVGGLSDSAERLKAAEAAATPPAATSS